MTIKSSYPSINALHAAAKLKTVKKLSLSPLNPDCKNQVQSHLKMERYEA
jgi:electron transfer flavoprotein alpha/beta subunit